MTPPDPRSRLAAAGAPRRDLALDLLRTLAIIGMMAAHTARLIIPDARPEWARLVLLIEPLIPSLFLFLVGLSLVHSFEAARSRGESARAWYGRQLRRAAGLWVVSAVFFALEMGIRLPDMLLAGGILANIAYAIVLTGALLALPAAAPRPRSDGLRVTVLLAALAGGGALFTALDLNGARVHPVNIGNSPFLPLWLFTFAGALWGTLTFRAGPPFSVRPCAPRAAIAAAATPDATATTPQKPQPAAPGTASLRPVRRLTTLIAGLAAAALALTAVILILRYGLDILFTKPFGRSDASRLVPAPVYGGSTLVVGYYNLKPVLALTCLGLHLAALLILQALFRAISGIAADRGDGPTALPVPDAPDAPGAPLKHVLSLGRHALLAYILHLALLATLVVVTGARQPLQTGLQGTGVLTAVVVGCHLAVILRQRNKNLRFGH